MKTMRTMPNPRPLREKQTSDRERIEEEAATERELVAEIPEVAALAGQFSSALEVFQATPSQSARKQIELARSQLSSACWKLMNKANIFFFGYPYSELYKQALGLGIGSDI